LITEHELVLVLDFGGQYTQLIARRVRELGVYCEIIPFNTPVAKIAERKPKGIILSGGPSSVYEEGAPHCDRGVLDLGVPVLGICYGMQLMAYFLDGQVISSDQREFGRATLRQSTPSVLLANVPTETTVWMSHGDKVTALPGFEILATTDNALAAAQDAKRGFYAIQFHAEVAHTPQGKEVYRSFLVDICKCRCDWSMASFIDTTIEQVRAKAGNARVICGLSGGVDSTVAAALVDRAIGDRLTCIFVDNGLLRKNEFDQVLKRFREEMQLNVIGVAAGERFLSKLAGVVDPERKRKIIGNEFIEVFQEEANKIGDVDFLVQGTLYPDVIESVSVKGPSQVIKSHHNVGGLPEKMHLKLIEPLRELFKDEVRRVGVELGLPEELVRRQPFPGPGLAVRILGEITPDRVALLQEADKVVNEEIRRADLYDSLWQSFAVLLPINSVGVMGDQRTYENVAAIRAVQSQDGMTADWARLPYDVLERISSRIVSEVRGINRVVYDISSKPPSTIEWE
jgi:GMP synthase (glutamine-hydrolysing)